MPLSVHQQRSSQIKSVLVKIACGAALCSAIIFSFTTAKSSQASEILDFHVTLTVPSVARELASLKSLSSPRAKNNILNDYKNIVNNSFSIQTPLKKRVLFWFDIYTKYDSKINLVHHSKYPWIVFKVVDTSPIYLKTWHKWTKYHRAIKLVDGEKIRVKATLRQLLRKKSFKHLKGFQKVVYDKLVGIKGPRKAVLREALRNIRSQVGQQNFFLSGIIESSQYLEQMEKHFKSRGLPKELTRIPFVESSFNTNARSKVGASGIWQIMPRTAKSYSIVNKHIDERNSPLKATKIASKILKSYYRLAGNWPLAVTAYNHGIGGIRKAIRNTKSHNINTIIKNYKNKAFGFASSNFYSSFLAVLYAETYFKDIFRSLRLTRKKPLKGINLVRIKSKISVKKILKITGLSSKNFLMYNMDLQSAIKHNAHLPKGFQIYLPYSIAHKFSRRFSVISRKAKASKI